MMERLRKDPVDEQKISRTELDVVEYHGSRQVLLDFVEQQNLRPHDNKMHIICLDARRSHPIEEDLFRWLDDLQSGLLQSPRREGIAFQRIALLVRSCSKSMEKSLFMRSVWCVFDDSARTAEEAFWSVTSRDIRNMYEEDDELPDSFQVQALVNDALHSRPDHYGPMVATEAIDESEWQEGLPDDTRSAIEELLEGFNQLSLDENDG